jgi:hypothetical protein
MLWFQGVARPSPAHASRFKSLSLMILNIKPGQKIECQVQEINHSLLSPICYHIPLLVKGVPESSFLFPLGTHYGESSFLFPRPFLFNI